MREFSNGWTRLCGLLPCSGSQASAVLAELEHFINLRIVAILKVFAELRVLVHCPLNAAVVVGLVVYQLQDVGGHIFENDREENLIGQSQVPGRVVSLQEAVLMAHRELQLSFCGARQSLLLKLIVQTASFPRHDGLL